MEILKAFKINPFSIPQKFNDHLGVGLGFQV
jgi:hypothetical protein